MRTLILFILILFVACEGQRKTNNSTSIKHTVTIDVENKLQNLGMEQFDTIDYKFIVLETSNKSLIGEINKLYIIDSLIVIFDSKQMLVQVFDTAGNYRYNIGRNGSGPDEYSNINDIFYDKIEQKIYLHERLKKQIYTYSLSGELLNKSEISKYMFESFCKTGEGYWVFARYSSNNNPEYYTLMLLDENLQEMKAGFFPLKTSFAGDFLSKFTCDETGAPYFFYPESNIIYKLSGKEVIPWFEIDFGSRTMPYDRIRELTDREIYDQMVSETRYLGQISNLQINNGKVYFAFSESGYGTIRTYNCLFNTNTGKTIIYNNPFLDNTGISIISKIYQLYDNKLVFSFEPSIYPEQSFPALSKFFSAPIDFESNPILFIFKWANSNK